VHLATACGTFLYVWLNGVTVVGVALFAVWTVACGFAVTGGYHRLFAHATYRAHALVKAFHLFFGAAAIENSALKWSKDHRRHHASTDEAADPYNITRGFWWAHIGWVFFKEEPGTPQANVKDLERDWMVQLQHRFYVPLAIFAGFLLPMGVGALLGDMWGGLVLAGFVRLVVLYHATFCVNSLAHMLGARPYSDKDSARDSGITALITMGEGYHNFHHTFPYDYRNGVRAWHFDPTKWLIRSLAWVGLARDLVRTPDDVILKARIAMQEKHAAEWLRDHPVAAARLRAAREKLEKLAETWAALKAQLAALRARAEGYSREALAALKREIRAARRAFREAYRTWVDSLERPRLLAAAQA
jgi:stearoyl-CoA desaturase (Delta-9 desaturase)